MNSRKMTTMILTAALIIACTVLTGCSKDNPVTPPPPPQEAFIKGNISLAPGLSIDLTNARVAVYDSQEGYEEDAWVAQAAVMENGNGFTFKVGPLNPGTYFLDIWKDKNNNGVIEWDEYYVYVTGSGFLKPIQVLEHKTTTINFGFTIGKSALQIKKG